MILWMITTSATSQNWKKNTLHGSFSYLLFQSPPIKLKLGLHWSGRLLIATHLDQSNYLANQKRKYSQFKHDLTLFIRLFQASESWAWVLHRIGLIAVPDPRFLVQGRSHTMRRWRYSKVAAINPELGHGTTVGHVGWESGTVWIFQGAEFEYCSTWARKKNQKFSSEKQMKNLMEYWEYINCGKEFWN
jgi:hypothetical protein